MDNTDGNLMLIPREPIHGKECFRLYVSMEVAKKALKKDLTRETATAEHAVLAARALIHPYKLEYDSINWFTAYPVAQRLASAFDVDQRVFLMGDACHTHSPKGGLGMNTSMMDAHNLSWKLALVTKGLAPTSLLQTYNLERRRVAEQLLQYDQSLMMLFRKMEESQGTAKEGLVQEWQRLQQTNSLYQMGVGITYGPNSAVSGHFDSAFTSASARERIPTGHRILPATVRRFRDVRVVQLLQEFSFDLRLKVIVFVGDLTKAENQVTLQALSQSLRQNPQTAKLLSKNVDTAVFDAYQDKAAVRSGSLLDCRVITSSSGFDPRVAGFVKTIRMDETSAFKEEHIYCDEVPAVSNLDYLMFHGRWFPPGAGEMPAVPPLEVSYCSVGREIQLIGLFPLTDTAAPSSSALARKC